MNTVTIGKTTKGHRVWIQALGQKGITAERFSVTFDPQGFMVLHFSINGKRKVTKDPRGGLVDIEGKKVSTWAGNATTAEFMVDTANQKITIVPMD